MSYRLITLLQTIPLLPFSKTPKSKEDKLTVIETEFHILPEEVFQECNSNAEELNVNIDYYLMEFCTLTEE